ncbi:fasciclin domain-containing protein [Labilibaculum sp.]|uniref:fasciclin domain-containing protein n=1 Tax=Labilibaculum sp. TaxID=2060723 RepID=UPI003563D0C0
MKHIYYFNFLLLMLALLALACQPDELVYARPDSLEGPIYQQLESTGEFSYYLACLDKTEYATSLKNGGSWTVFAFDDTAFEEFMDENGYTSFEEIPELRLTNIIKYSIIIDSYSTTTLTYYSNGWYEGNSYRRYTQYSDSLTQMNSNNYPNSLNEPNKTYWVDESRGVLKTTSYFLDAYFELTGHYVEFEDYDFMFPGQNYVQGGMKVFESDVVETGLIGENGLIYHLDKVIEPRQNMYQWLSNEENDSKYSIFKSIIDRFGYFKYSYTDEITNDSIFQLRFLNGVESNYIAFEPNHETYPNLIANINYTEVYSTGLLAPTNETLTSYLASDNIMADYYSSYDDMPLDVLAMFANMNFFTRFWDICPSHFGETYTVGLDPVNLTEDDVVEQQYCSNGLVVGVNKIYEADCFSTVMGPLLLDQDYSIMLDAVQELDIASALESKGVSYSVMGVKNDQFIDVADPNSSTRIVSVVFPTNGDPEQTYLQVTGDPDASDNRIYPDPDEVTPSSTDVSYVSTTLASIIENQIVEDAFNMGNSNYYQTMSGEYVYVNGSEISGGGDIANETPVSIASTRITENGNFYEMSSFISRPEYYTYGTLLQDLSTYSRFVEVIDGAGVKVAIADRDDDYLISFISTKKNYTLFVPTNEAVQQAVDDGVIPDPTTSSLNALSSLDRAQATIDLANFAKKHCILVSVPTDGETSGTYSSMYYDKIVDYAPVYIEYEIENDYATQSITIKDVTTGEVKAETTDITNVLSKKVVIHQIDDYLR